MIEMQRTTPEVTATVLGARLRSGQPYVVIFPENLEVFEAPDGDGLQINMTGAQVCSGGLLVQEDLQPHIVATICQALVINLRCATGDPDRED